MWADDAGCRETINAAELDLQKKVVLLLVVFPAHKFA